MPQRVEMLRPVRASIVTEVIVGNDEGRGTDWEAYYAAVRGQRCVRTSYNGRIRGKYAGIGDRYDEQADVFVPPVTEAAGI